MQFASFSEFLHMGGYALYVWLAYGMGLIVLVALVLNTRNGHKQQLKQLQGMLQREQAQAQRQEPGSDTPSGSDMRGEL